jgi:hypothetical protein
VRKTAGKEVGSVRLVACLALIGLVVSSSVVVARPTASGSPIIDETFSFENDFQGWEVHGTNIDPNLPSPVTRSQDMAKDGVYSLRFDVNRDAFFQFLWIERVFDVEPNQVYDVEIGYSLGTRDCCSNPFFNLAGTLNRTPEILADLTSLGQDIVDNGTDTTVYKWVDKQYTGTHRSDDQGRFHILIGFFGDFDFRRIEYIDSVHIRISKRPDQCQFFSFENDMEGWTPGSIDLSTSGGSDDWSIGPVLGGLGDGDYRLEFLTRDSSESAKVFIIRPFAVERKKSYLVSIDYEFSDHSIAQGARVITGVLKDVPQVEGDLVPFYQEKTHEHGVRVPRHLQYEFAIRSKKSEVLYAVIGFAAMHSGHHLYDIDVVCVTITEQ